MFLHYGYSTYQGCSYSYQGCSSATYQGCSYTAVTPLIEDVLSLIEDVLSLIKDVHDRDNGSDVTACIGLIFSAPQ
jgi:hypothetical protein